MKIRTNVIFDNERSWKIAKMSRAENGFECTFKLAKTHTHKKKTY